MKAGIAGMRDLLEKAGFHIRSATRADCIHCHGRSLATVSYTTELAYCHRCNWRANTLILMRQLRLCHAPKDFAAFRTELRRRLELESQITLFDQWRNAQIRKISDRYRSLSGTAARAERVLADFPDCEPAWDAVARFYHAEAQLSAAFDWLMFKKVSVWLDQDSTPVEVFKTWKTYAAA